MNPHIKVITLAVNDLARSLAFYRDGLGLPTQGIIGTEFEDGAVAFFNMNDDLILALYPKAALAKDAKVPVSPPSPSEFSIGHIVGSKQEVDAIMQRANEAGASMGNCLESGMGSQAIAVQRSCAPSPLLIVFSTFFGKFYAQLLELAIQMGALQANLVGNP